MSEYFHYISKSDYNFNISLLKYSDIISFFDDIDMHIKELQGHMNTLPDLTSKNATYIIGTFMLISLRQMRNAFHLFLRRMSYDGMLLFRVGLESAVFAFRIFKNNELAKVWALKEENWKSFSKEFRTNPFPNDMPFRKDIRSQLDLLNNYWSHPNIDYFSTSTVFTDRNTQKGSKQILLHFYDHKENNYLLNIIWFLDSSIKIVTVYRKIFENIFPILITSTAENFQRLLNTLMSLKMKYKVPAV